MSTQLPDLVDAEALAALLQQDVEDDEKARKASELAVRVASGVVRRYCSDDFLDGAPADVELVVLRVASRIFKNPQGASVYSYDGVVGQTPQDISGRILTPDERVLLDAFCRTHAGAPSFSNDPPCIEWPYGFVYGDGYGYPPGY